MSEFKATHTTPDRTPVMIAVSHPLDPALTIVVDEDGSPEMWARADLAPIPHKPEPPAEVWLSPDGTWWNGSDAIGDQWHAILAPEGSAVIPPDAVELALIASTTEWRGGWSIILSYLRAARGGAS